MRSPNRRNSAFSLVESLFAVALVGLSFGALYALSGQALAIAKSGRDSTSAWRSVEARMEMLRNCTWRQATDEGYLRTSVLNTPGLMESSGTSVVETVTVSTYPKSLQPPIKIVRKDGQARTTQTNTKIYEGDLVQIDVSLTWSSSPNNRVRTQATSTLIARLPQ